MKLAFDVTRSDPAIGPDAITRLEESLLVAIPSDYKQFLLTHNGGYPEYEAFHYDGDKSFALQRFYPLTSDDMFHVRFFRDAYGESVPDLLEIGISSFGDALCLVVGELHHGSVWWYDHEYDPDDDPHNGLTQLAATFTDFVKGLRPD